MKPITREDLLHRIPNGSPYEAVIVAAREARRLNRARIARQALFPPMGSGLGASATDLSAASGLDALADDDPLSMIGESAPVPGLEAETGQAHPEAHRDPGAEAKVTMQAIERLAKGEVTYRISEGPIEPEED